MRTGWVVVAALAGSLTLAVTFPLLDPDEGRNAEVAREISASGDWGVPHLARIPYLDKPPGLFWAAALPIQALGPSPLAARLPAVAAAVATLILLGRFARKYGGSEQALIAVALLAGAPLFAVLSAYVIMDMPLALCVTVTWTSLATELLGEERSGDRSEARARNRTRWALFAAISAGVLLKGPVMLAWAIGGSLATAMLLGSRAPLRWVLWWPGWILLLATAGSWFAIACARYPEYPRYAFLEESVERLTTSSFKREQPIWFVPVVLIAGALPWSLATPWGRLAGTANGPHSNPMGPRAQADETARMAIVSRVALGFLLFAVAFFTFSRSKLVTYLLPALPPLAWLAASAWREPGRARRGAWGVAILYLVLAGGLAWVTSSSHDRPPGIPTLELPSPWWSALFLLLALVAAAGAVIGSARPALFAVVAFTPVLFAIAGSTLVRYAEDQSGAPLARAIHVESPEGTVRYEYCYSPGTDYLLGRPSELVSELGHETASNYQLRYRHRLIERGEWVAWDAPPAGRKPAVIVRPRRREAELGRPPGYEEFYRDRRFVAYRMLGVTR